MTDPFDPTSDPLDDQIRDALRAEAEGVKADPTMLNRIKATRTPTGRSRGAWLLAAAAIAALVVGTAVVLVDRDDDEPIEVGPSADTTSTTTTSDPTTTTTTETTASTVPANRPTEAVAVTEQGRLVVVDAASGEVIRDLGGFDDPTDPEVADREGGAYSITGVALHPNGTDVYFETCCEPAAGAIYKVPVDGSVIIGDGSLEPVAFGFGIDISADGRWLAFVDPTGPVVRDIETGDEVRVAEGGEGYLDLVQVAVDADGTELTVEQSLEYSQDPEFRVVRSQLLTFRREGATLVDTGETTGGEIRLLPVYSAEGTVLTTLPARNGLVDLNVDASGLWFLATPEDMPLRGYTDAADEQEIPGTYVAADW